MAAQRRHLEERRTEYDERVFRGEEQFRLQRDETLRRIEELERRRQAKLEAFRHLGVVHQDPEVERAAMAFVMRYERERGREPEDVSARHDGSGFDVRSVERTPTGERVRRIEVKGRSAPSGDVGLYRTEWYAAQRFRDGYWLYVVYGALGPSPRLVTVQDPWGRLRGVREVAEVTGYQVPGASIEECASEGGR